MSAFTDEDAARLLARAESSAQRLIANAQNDVPSIVWSPSLLFCKFLMTFCVCQCQDVNSDGKPWILDFEKPELRLKVYYSEVPGSPLRLFKATCQLPRLNMEHMWDVLDDTKHRCTWDRNIADINTTSVRVYSAERGQLKQLGLFRSATKAVGPISAREFIDVTIMKNVDKDIMVSAGAGLTVEETCGHYPPAKGYVRGFNNLGSGWYFQRIPATDTEEEGVQVAYCIMSDLKGWFPYSA
jgi:hypothetical protein